MKLDWLGDWITLLGLSGVLGTLVAMMARAIIDRRSQNHEHRWQDERELRDRTQETDRATYNQPLTILVRVHLAAFVCTGEWTLEEEVLGRLLTSLRQRTYEHILDADVNAVWVKFVMRSLDLASRRLTVPIRESEIRSFIELRTEWEDACKRSFGPLPSTPVELPRRPDHDAAAG